MLWQCYSCEVRLNGFVITCRGDADLLLRLFFFFLQKLLPKCQTGRKRIRPPLTHVSTQQNKEILLIFQSQSYVPLILRSPWLKVVVVCVRCICKRTRNGRCVRRVHAHFFVFSYEPPSILPTYTRYRLSVPLFFYDYVVLHCYGVPVCVNCTCVR